MKTIDLSRERIPIEKLLDLARKEPLLLLTGEGEEFLLSGADDFDQEVEALRSSEAFHHFLDERSRSGRRIPLEDIQRELSDRETD